MSSSSIGQRFVFTSFGESHGKCIGATVDGCPAGLEIGERDIQTMLDLRKPGQSIITTQRKEDDKVEILSGTYKGHTTGAPITMIIWNKDQHSKDYDNLTLKPRPGHSDYPAFVKYNGFNDIRGGGRFSGRLTATFVMAGAIARKLLSKTLGIETFSYTCQVGSVKMKEHATMKMKNSVYSNEVRCPDPKIASKMRETILAARRRGDSIGGIVESLTVNLPVGLGEPIFGSLESDLSKALFSIPAVKGVEFGSGFHGSTLHGSENNDEFLIKNGKIQTKTNNAGGILGGISTGMPIVLRVAFKPASSIAKKQQTIDLHTKKSVSLVVQGRHDPCVVPRAPPVVDSLVSVVLADHAIRAGFIPPVIR
ncbi:chorismate synthase [Candidatus Nitrosotalea okcheonensis]|uniref:Chorismate synthase n=1 Tax=Candidatus Nitrosotalea okcheonensis TaxID=1903276 RepID=A0A2H1FCE6_9ARCH|nr:chorismate synthase [Candidatus Nitrosotalea okcheonensis]MDE1831662.1 chorismate synthase [Nitrososphaerota archaeon]MDE1841502.1 chorismate synthase [Nitrososphaerota archaeon]MDE1878612.1 chorismate synthase [Nitrososphaerota archaeon]SMH70319.1 Chorismate synthase [Candidatus Nitrosotalea okcheonensis]